MIKIESSFESRVLNTRVKLIVVLPNKIEYLQPIDSFKEYYKYDKLKTLLLLHGAWDNGESWIENTNISRYVDENNIALILPSVGNSFYKKKFLGEDFFEYITEEILGFAKNLFPLSDKKEDNFVGGVSMGGYGAFKIAFKRPDLFSKAFSLSGAMDLQNTARLLKTVGINLDNVFENVRKINDTEDDIYVILNKALEEGAKIPDLYQGIGYKDYMYEGNQKFRNEASKLGINLTYEEGPGDHDWKFWNEYVEKAILWCLK